MFKLLQRSFVPGILILALIIPLLITIAQSFQNTYLPVVEKGITPTPTRTLVPTRTPTATRTRVPTVTFTSTPTKFPTATPTVTNTPIRTPTATRTATTTQTPTQPPYNTGNVVITTIYYDPPGSEEPGEFVEICNDDTHSIQLAHWTLRDEAYHIFTFPNFIIQPDQVCRIYTNENHPEWCGFNYHSGAGIWNNTGDCGYLRDASNTLIDEYCYP